MGVFQDKDSTRIHLMLYLSLDTSLMLYFLYTLTALFQVIYTVPAYLSLLLFLRCVSMIGLCLLMLLTTYYIAVIELI